MVTKHATTETCGKLYMCHCMLQELCVLYLAVYINGDKVNFVNGIGLVVCLCGIALHVILKAVYGKYLLT